MEEDNRIVHGLWIGKKLFPVEILCISSFMAHGHQFHLWVYEELETVLPPGVIVEKASEIIPAEKVFCYKNTNQFGHGKGSYAGFSDIFRYKLLYEKGGWWTDMDVTCLKPLDFQEPYVFRNHQVLPVVGNIMKCPAGSLLMKLCYEQALAQVDENNTDWHKPIQILNDNITNQGLEKHIKSLSNPDKWSVIRKFIVRNKSIHPSWYVIHWVNEEWRRNKINKNSLYKGSSIATLYEKYVKKNENTIVRATMKEKIKLSYAGMIYFQLKTRMEKLFCASS